MSSAVLSLDLVGPDEDLSSVTVEEEVVQQELQTMLHKTRRLMQRNEKKIEAQKVRYIFYVYMYERCSTSSRTSIFRALSASADHVDSIE